MLFPGSPSEATNLFSPLLSKRTTELQKGCFFTWTMLGYRGCTESLPEELFGLGHGGPSCHLPSNEASLLGLSVWILCH